MRPPLLTTHPSLLAIVGPTASGKTDLALKIAQKHGGEIICADSRTIYKGMDIGTAKPTMQQRSGVPHHCLDMLEPNQKFSAAEFKVAANKAIRDIWKRGSLPILVGGSGLYVYAFIYDYKFPAGGENPLRRKLEQLPLEELATRLRRLDPEKASGVDLKNRRRIIRAIETAGKPISKSDKLPRQYYLIGLNPEQAILKENIKRRTDQMLEKGLANEASQLIDRFGYQEPFNTVGYAETIQFHDGQIDLEEARRLINIHSNQLAKRQMTWYKRNPDIKWVKTAPDGIKLAEEFLAQPL